MPVSGGTLDPVSTGGTTGEDGADRSARAVRRLGELEQAVMDVLWSADPDAWHTVREVQDGLSGRDAAYTTVMTVLDRLAKKGVVLQERAGRAYRYRAAASRSELTADFMHNTLASFGASERRSALVAFVADADADDLDALREALAELDE